MPTSLPPLARAIPHIPFPVEVYAIIIGFLDKPELAVCGRVSRSFYTLATALLYRSIDIESATDNPLFSFDTPSASKVRVGKESGRAKKGRTKARGVVAGSTTVPLVPLPDRFSYTKDLTIGTHYKYDCPSLPVLNMPNLTTLHIRGWCLDLCLPEPPFHFLDMGFAPRGHALTPKPTPCCPSITSLRPSRLVFNAPSMSAMGLWPSASNSFPPPWVTELVVPYTVRINTIRDGNVAHGVLGSLPDTVRKLSIVLKEGDGGWDQGLFLMAMVRIDGVELAPLTPSSLWKRIAGLSRGQAQVVEYIGVETIQAGHRGISTDGITREIRDAVKERGVAAGWEVAKAEARAEGIIFTTKEEYEKRQME
ncbi:uncharacterized protein MKK02DRAFT_43071 [Dioszegia hungarica]|uniref:F-box domain-containing protein n=1 Tax=Dioszegia hungarica TaxID=4972 RepID=A0AA38LWR9_9TREE|nr:uncharacterized protein MKK02DRAFT_43071 [Dioszegia hungarica]KAI9638670.1 hypothetical protein MKK02DRAFT_43071 [Dioszegia hungarica]